MARKGIPTLSLFSGAGGLDLGFLEAGFDIRACVEIEPSYCATLQENLKGDHGYAPGTVVHCVDIRKFDCRPYRDAGIRCIIGGPPCQTFSAAGRRSGGVIGTEDERGQLFKAYCRILDEVQPEVFVFENVYGLPGANGGKPWRQILAAFSRRGYTLEAQVVDAADYGVPQHRERLIMVGYKKGKFVFPMPTHGPDSKSQRIFVSVLDAISDLQSPSEPFHNDLGGMYGHLLPLVPEGLNYSFFTAEMGHPEPVFAWRSKFHDLLYKANRYQPCRTIKAQPGKFTGPFHWKNRHFTAAELKRLQTFPDEYKIVGGFGKVVEQIGNSVPPKLANVMASAVREQLLEGRKKLQFPIRPIGFQSTFRQRQRNRSASFNEIAASANMKRSTVITRKTKSKAGVSSYFLNPATLFDKSKYREGARLDESLPIFAVEIVESDRHVRITVERSSEVQLPASKIEMSGLRKYLPRYDTLSVEAKLVETSDIFHVWGAVEDALVERSRFFTLIDIYGHYANRGDTVDVQARWNFLNSDDALKAINYFSNTNHCGAIENDRAIIGALGLSTKKLAALVEKMRAIRFDIRTSKTHPIIGGGRVLCTYPFPLLSPRALVESKVRLISRKGGDDRPFLPAFRQYA